MAFLSKVGNILKQTASRQINGDLSAAKPFIYQALRFMSSSKLFVGGLSYGTDQQGLREAFSKYGEVIEARVILDRETGRSRGFGFVTYVSNEEASSAIQALDGQDLHGRRVRVNYAADRQPPRFQSSYGGGDSGYGGGGGGYGYGGGNESGGYSGGGGGGYSGGGGYGGGGNYNNDFGGQGFGAGGNFNSPGSYGGGGSAGGYGAPDTTSYGSASNSGFGGNYNSVAGGADGSNFSGGGMDGGSGMGFGAGEQQFDHSPSGNMEHAAGGYGQDDSLDGNYKDNDDDEPDDYAKRA